MLRKTIVLTTAFIVLSSVCHADDVDEYFRQAERQRKEQLRVAEINVQQGNAGPGIKASDRAFLLELKKQRPYMHSLELETGSVGIVTKDALIIQRIDNNTALIQLPFPVGYEMLALRYLVRSKEFTLLLKGVDLSDFVDKDSISLKRIMKVTGTETYTAVSGASRTVRTLEPVSPEDQDKILKRIDEIKNEPDTQRRAEAAEKAKAAAVAKEARLADKEGTAASKLKPAKALMTTNPEKAKQRLAEIIEQYPQTKAAKEAKELMRQLAEK